MTAEEIGLKRRFVQFWRGTGVCSAALPNAGMCVVLRLLASTLEMLCSGGSREACSSGRTGTALDREPVTCRASTFTIGKKRHRGPGTTLPLLKGTFGTMDLLFLMSSGPWWVHQISCWLCGDPAGLRDGAMVPSHRCKPGEGG